MSDQTVRDQIDRVLVVAPTPFFGDRGCHVRIYEEVRALEGLGVSAEIVTYPDGNDVPGIAIRRSVAIPGLRPRALGPGYSRPILDVSLLATGINAARRFRPQVIHAHLHEGIALGTALRALVGVPLVADLQGSLRAEMIDHGFLADGSAGSAAIRRVERWLVRQPDALVTSSAAGVGFLIDEGADPTRVASLPDGVDLQHFRPEVPDTGLRRRLGLNDGPVVVFLGVLTRYQGVDALLDAVPQVVRAVPRAQFLIMGYPNEDHYRARVRAMSLESHVTIPGRIPYDDAAKYLALGCLAVSAKQSLTEANGKLLNYMACALPVVATDTPVNREILGPSGVFAPVGDTDALAAAIVSLLRDEGRRRGLADALRKRVEEQFTSPAIGERLIQIYRRVAAPVP